MATRFGTELGITLLMGKNSAYVREICEIFASTGGFGDASSNAVNEILLQLTFVAMVTKFGKKRAITRLLGKISARSLRL